MRASFLRYLGFFFFFLSWKAIILHLQIFCNECIEILHCGDEANPLLIRSFCCLDV